MLKRTKKLSALLLALVMVLSLAPMNVFASRPNNLISNRDQAPTTAAELVDFRASIRYSRTDAFLEMREFDDTGRATVVAAADIPTVLPRNLSRLPNAPTNNTYFPLAELAKFLSAGFNVPVSFFVNPANDNVVVQVKNAAGTQVDYTFITAPNREVRVVAAATAPATFNNANAATLASDATNGWIVGDVLTVFRDGIPHIPMRGVLQSLGVAIHWNSSNHDLTYFFPQGLAGGLDPIHFLFGTTRMTPANALALRDVGTWTQGSGVSNNVWTAAADNLEVTVVPAADEMFQGQRVARLRNTNDANGGDAIYLILFAGDRLPRGTLVGGPVITGYVLGDAFDVQRFNLTSGDAHVILIPANTTIHLLFAP